MNQHFVREKRIDITTPDQRPDRRHRAHAGDRHRDPRRLGRHRLAARAAARARPVAPDRAHGLQGHRAALGPADRRGHRECRRRHQRRDERRIHELHGTRSRRGRGRRPRRDRRHPHQLGLRSRRARPREGRDPAGIRRRRGYARRPRSTTPSWKRPSPDQAIGRPILGTPDTVKSFDEATIRAFLAREYTPGKMVLAAAGDVDHAQIVDAAERLFGAMPAVAAQQPEPGRYTGGERRISRKLEQANLVLGLPGLSFKDPGLLRDPSLRPYSRRRADLAPLARGARDARPRLFHRLVPLALLRLRPVRHRRRNRGSGRARVDGRDARLHASRRRRTSSEIELIRAKAQMKVALLTALETPGGRIERIARQLLSWGRLISERGDRDEGRCPRRWSMSARRAAACCRAPDPGGHRPDQGPAIPRRNSLGSARLRFCAAPLPRSTVDPPQSRRKRAPFPAGNNNNRVLRTSRSQPSSALPSSLLTGTNPVPLVLVPDERPKRCGSFLSP